MIPQNAICRIANLRLIVGYLGEKEQYNWWASSFLSKSSDSFLKHVFTRTVFLSKYQGVVQAASRVHDGRVGLGDIYHLFRLPETIEQRLHHFVINDGSLLWNTIADIDEAMNELRNGISIEVAQKEGPITVGNVDELAMEGTLDTISRLYHTAFKKQTIVFPYFNK